MFSRAIGKWLRKPGRRHLAATLSALVVLVSSGLPCTCVCLADEANAAAHDAVPACHHEGSHESDADHNGGQDQDQCPAPSICATDQVPAVAIDVISHVPTLEPLAALQCAPSAQAHPALFASSTVAPGARSSPNLPAFAILRL